jgi:hypothetical protein
MFKEHFGNGLRRRGNSAPHLYSGP